VTTVTTVTPCEHQQRRATSEQRCAEQDGARNERTGRGKEATAGGGLSDDLLARRAEPGRRAARADAGLIRRRGGHCPPLGALHRTIFGAQHSSPDPTAQRVSQLLEAVGRRLRSAQPASHIGDADRTELDARLDRAAAWLRSDTQAPEALWQQLRTLREQLAALPVGDPPTALLPNPSTTSSPPTNPTGAPTSTPPTSRGSNPAGWAA
jgi:hypothetical protein